MKRKIGINGLGRVGKLLTWDLISSGKYSEIVINTGIPKMDMDHIANYIERDSTYGSLADYLFGKRSIDSSYRISVNKDEKIISINEIKIFFTEWKNPLDIPWKALNIELVVDATGKFLNPFISSDSPEGSLKGHLEGGAETVLVSAPFQLAGKEQPADCITTIMGINHNAYNPQKHRIVSAASCTTTCLAHMVKPLFEVFSKDKILSISMVTVHALTSDQPTLDLIPDGRYLNERFYRSAINNIILTSTGATRSLQLVLPEMQSVGFITQSVRVPITTGSLIIMTVNVQGDDDDLYSKTEKDKWKERINEEYKLIAKNKEEFISLSERPHVSEDIKGLNKAVLIEGCETHARTAEATVEFDSKKVRIPIVQATIYGWYDNEMGNFVNMLSKNIDHIFNSNSKLHSSL